MNRLTKFLSLAALACVCAAPAHAGFTLSVDPTTLQFDGPGTYNVPVLITHDSNGASSLSSFSFQFSGPDASGAAATADSNVVTGATEGIPVGTTLGAFSFNAAADTVAATDFTFVGQDIGDGGTATLFNVELMLGSEASYQIGVDFQNANRGFGDISDEFALGAGFDTPIAAGAASGVGFDTSFTMTANAIPEPSSVVALASIAGLGLYRVRRRKTAKS